MSDCPGIVFLADATSTSETYRNHCPGCQENTQLRAQLLQAHDDRARDLGLAYEAGDKLREQLDRTEKQVEEQIAGSCELVEENTQLRAQLARARAYIRGLGHAHRTFDPPCNCDRCRALADLPDAPEKEQ